MNIEYETLQKDLPKEIIIDKQQFDNVMEKYISFLPLAVRKNPQCICDDEYCPHKQKISPLLSFFLFEDLAKCYKYNGDLIKDFNPLKYDIVDIKDYNDPKLCVNKDKGKVLYERFRIPITINKNYKPNRFFNIFEGIELEINEQTYLELKDKIKIQLNGYTSKTNIQVKKNNGKYEILLGGQYIPLKLMTYTEINFIFDYVGQLNGYVVGGFLNYVDMKIFEWKPIPLEDNYLILGDGHLGFKYNE